MSQTFTNLSKQDVERICKSQVTAMSEFLIEQDNKLLEKIRMLEEDIKILRSGR